MGSHAMDLHEPDDPVTVGRSVLQAKRRNLRACRTWRISRKPGSGLNCSLLSILFLHILKSWKLGSPFFHILPL